MKILLTGSTGQLGKALIASAPKFINAIPVHLIKSTRSTLNLANSDECFAAVNYYRPDWIVNTGAFTSVEEAETNPGLAFSINAEAPKSFAKALHKFGGQLLHLSTDFVFDGLERSPYSPLHKRNPLNNYGISKALGEQAIEELLFPTKQATILRTSWLMGPVGNNFLLTILRLHKERNEISVISDQIGCPTSTVTLAKVCWKFIELYQGKIIQSLNYLHWSDLGIASWYEVAIKIGEFAYELDLISQMANVIPIMSSEYPSKVNRPKYSVLNSDETVEKLSISNTHWNITIKNILKDLI